ncbi:MAG TPA: porin [Polyangia bacterium]|jgi:phosphate-selective porin
MPVRPISVGSLILIVMTMLAAGGRVAVAAPRADPTEADEDAAPAPKTKAKAKPKPTADEEPEVTPADDSANPPAPPPPPPAPAPAADVETPGARPTETVGFSDRLFVRTPGDEVVVFPGGRVQVDGAAFPRQTPKSGVFLRRARVELTGWLGRIFYFDASADFAPSPPPGGEPPAPSALPATDNYVALAPFRDAFILQAGQFDAPFTLENRTSDAYTTFIERSFAVRSLGVPRNKEVGVMAHGLVGDVFYYSGGVFNGDGPDFRNFDNQVDAIGRGTVAPFASREGPFRRLSLGGSGWFGRHVLGPTFPLQATTGGVQFLNPVWTTGQPARTYQLLENGYLVAFAAELSLPLGPRFGLRGEGVFKQQELAESEVVTGTTPVTAAGNATLTGIGGYGEMWFWLAGDERMLPAPGLQLPNRTDKRYRRAFDDGLMLALRGEFIKEDLTTGAPTLGDPTRATTRVISGTAGANYWRGAFARISINYVVNMWSGTSETIKALRAQELLEHELLVRFAISL